MSRKENLSDHDAGLIPLKGDRKEVELCRRDSDCSIVLRKFYLCQWRVPEPKQSVESVLHAVEPLLCLDVIGEHHGSDVASLQTLWASRETKARAVSQLYSLQ